MKMKWRFDSPRRSDEEFIIGAELTVGYWSAIPDLTTLDINRLEPNEFVEYYRAVYTSARTLIRKAYLFELNLLPVISSYSQFFWNKLRSPAISCVTLAFAHSSAWREFRWFLANASAVVERVAASTAPARAELHAVFPRLHGTTSQNSTRKQINGSDLNFHENETNLWIWSEYWPLLSSFL